MNITDRVKTNIIFKFIGEFVSRLIIIFFYIYVARKLGDAGFGKYSFAISFCGLFMVFMDMGINTLLIREIAKEKNRTYEYVSNITTLKIILSVFVFILISLTISILKYPSDTRKLVMIMAFVTIGVAFLEYLCAVFSSWEKMDYEAWIKIFNKIIVTILGISILLLGYGLNIFIASIAVGYFITIILGIYLINRNIIRIGLKYDLLFWIKAVRDALPLGLSMVFILIAQKIDIVLLSFFNTPESKIGWYSAGIKIIEVLHSIPFIISGAIFPVLCDIYANRQDSFKIMYERLIKYISIIVVPIVFGIFILADKIVVLVYGRGYINTIYSLRITIWSVMFIFFNFILTNLLVTVNKQKYNAISTFVCMLSSIIFNIILIPKYGYIGTSICVLTTQLILFLFNLIFLSSDMDLKTFSSSMKPLIAGILMSVIIVLFNSLNLFILIIIGAIVYFLVIWLIRTFDDIDLVVIRKMIKGVI